MTQTPKIRLRDVHKRFGSLRVLRGIDLEIEAGESLVVIGGSGTGKSVLLKSVLGLLEPDQGTIEIDGEDTTRLRGAQRTDLLSRFGMLFQGGALFDSLTVWQNIAFQGLQRRTLKRSDAHDLAVRKLADVGLQSDVANMMPVQLSGGMQKRVALARAIATDPEIIFFDEPTTGLDPIMGDVINDLIVKCTKELGATALSITHDMASARKIADKIAMLYEGELIWQGAATAIDDSNNPYVDQFIHGRAEGPIKMPIEAD
ncbi:MAG: ATP-binding cassette domain-containing protein [Pseudomonadota bacterium]